MATLVDVLRIAFFAAATVLTVMMMLKLGSNSRMTMVDLPMNWVYGVCLLGFAAMAVRSVQVALLHRQRGYRCWSGPNPRWTTADPPRENDKQEHHAQDHLPAAS